MWQIYAAFFREEEPWLRLEELLVREDEEPRPVVVALPCVLSRPDEEELPRPEEMLLVLELRSEELRLELPELALREDVAELRVDRLLPCPLARSSSG